MAKRAPPSASDDRTLKAGKTIGSTAVNISDSDALKTGRYRVTCESNGSAVCQRQPPSWSMWRPRRRRTPRHDWVCAKIGN